MDKLLEKLKQNSEGLYIARIPKKDKQKFIEFANEEFCGDYGMCFKFLLNGIVDPDINILLEQIQELYSRLEFLETRLAMPEQTNSDDKIIKTVSGKQIRK